MNLNKPLKLLIYGISDQVLNLQICGTIDGIVKTRIINQVIDNIHLYFKDILFINTRNLYIFFKDYFFPLSGFHFKHLAVLKKNNTIVIAYSEVDLTNNFKAQQKIIRDLNLQLNIRPSLRSIKDNLSKSVKSFDNLKGFKLTENLATVSTLPGNKHSFIYSMNKFGPCSYLKKCKIKDVNKLQIPIYFGSNFIKQNYNTNEFITFPIIFKAFELNKNGELVLKDKQIIDKQKSIMGEVFKQNSWTSLIKGKKFSLPAHIFQPKTNLIKLTEYFANLKFLHQAIEATESLEKFKLVIIMLVSNFYYALGIQFSLNPYLGETLQGYFSEGTQVYMERISHQPPKDAFYCVNDEKGFKLHGTFENSQEMSGNEGKINYKGTITIELGNEKIYAELAHIYSSGIFFGKKKIVLKDNFYFYYPNKNMKAIVGFGQKSDYQKADELYGGIYKTPDKNLSRYSSIGRKLFDSKKEKNYKQYKLDDDMILVSKISGSWVRSISFDNKIYWEHKQPCYQIHLFYDALPSDWRFREDLIWLAYNEKDNANQWKLKLEEVYRDDRKRRQQYIKKIKKKKQINQQ